MLANRSSLSRFAFPQTSAEWEQVCARYLAVLAKVPLSAWQFLVRLLLVLILSLSLARLFWLLLPAPVMPVANVVLAPVSSPVDAGNSSVNIAQLKALNLFGKVVEAPKQSQPAALDGNAVKTSLNLTLVGVVESSDESSARAIISTGDRQDVYAINAPLPVGANVTLSKVMVDRVIINNNGQYESLWLYQSDPNAPSVSREVSTAQPISMKSADALPARGNTYGPEVQVPQEARPAPEARAAQGGDGTLAEVSRNLSDVVAMSIHRENGQVIGYKIRPGRDAEKFKAVGLQADDIVTAINGMPLTNPAKIMEIYKNMGNTTSASLEIKRGGSLITVNVEIQ